MPTPRNKGSAQTETKAAPAKKAPSKLTGPGRRKELRSKLPAATQFVFIHHWSQWQVQAGVLVPMLSPVPLHAGLHGTRVAKNGDINARNYLGKKLDEGWLVLDDYTATQDGEPYAAPILNEKDEEVWLSRWSAAIPGSDTVVPDEKGYTEWLQWLVEQGIIPAIQPYVLDALIDKTQAAALDAQQAAVNQATLLPRAERLSANLEVLRAHKAQQQETADV